MLHVYACNSKVYISFKCRCKLLFINDSSSGDYTGLFDGGGGVGIIACGNIHKLGGLGV